MKTPRTPKGSNQFVLQEYYGGGWIIQDYQIQNLEGRLLTFIESFGLRESQEKAVKDLVRQEVWNLISSNCFWLGSEEHTALRKKYQGLNGTAVPPGVIDSQEH